MSTVEERKIRNQNIVRLAASGVAISVIAETYKLGKPTISKILKEHKMELESKMEKDSSIIEARSKELVDQAAYHLYKSAKAAAQTVTDIMEYSEDARVKLTAAFGVLDRVGLSPRKPAGESSNDPDFVSSELAEKLVEALETAAKRPALEFGENTRILINNAPVELEKDTPFESELVIPEGKVKDVEEIKEEKIVPQFGLKPRTSE